MPEDRIKTKGSVMATILTMDASAGKFLINGKPAFLLGVSYYGGLTLEAREAEADLRRMAALGFNWIRLWCTWGSRGHDVSAVTADGQPRQPYMGRLLDYCRLADGLGMIVDVSFQRGVPQEARKESPALDSFADCPWVMSPVVLHQRHLAAVQTVTEALKPFRNVYIDVANERNIHPLLPVAFDEAAEMIAMVRQTDPERLVTISDAGDINDSALADYINHAKVDFLTPHRPRHAASPSETEARTRHYRQMAAQLGRPMPVHYQEPFRRDFTPWQPEVDDFMTDLAGAARGGAAGWCLHNGYSRNSPDGYPWRGFDLRCGPLFDQLDEVERGVLEQAGQVVASLAGG